MVEIFLNRVKFDESLSKYLDMVCECTIDPVCMYVCVCVCVCVCLFVHINMVVLDMYMYMYIVQGKLSN